MLLDDLRKQIRMLASVEETEAPVLSAYLSLELPESRWRTALAERLNLLRSVLPATTRRFLDEALDPVESYLERDIEKDSRGIALFSRGGKRPLFVPLQFGAPIATSVSLKGTPNIYHLVEMKDTYDRYVVLLASSRSVRILDVNLGSITKQMCREMPQLVRRLSGDWARTHYENRQRNALSGFLGEQIRVLDRLMSAGGHSSLILAGPAQSIATVQRALPRHLSAKIVGTLAAREKESVANIVAASMTAFAQKEELSSRAIAGKLVREIMVDGLAVAGISRSMAAMRASQAEMLVLAAPEAETADLRASELVPATVREELVRTAERHACHVEVVKDSPELLRLGGVGCLLRFRPELRAGESELRHRAVVGF